MRFPSQLLLTGAVVGVVTASTSTALTLTANAPAPQLGSAITNTPAPAPPTAVPEPLADGAQIAALAAAPARARATDVVEQRRSEQPRPAPQTAPRTDGSGGSAGRPTESDWQRLPASVRQMARDACASGLLTGPSCETA